MEKETQRQARRHLRKDKILARLTAKYPPPRWEKKKDLFGALLYEIVGQQLSGQVARILFSRFLSLFPGRQFPRPAEVLSLPDEKIRACGVSWAKVRYLKSAAAAVVDGSLNFRRLRRLSDDEVHRRLLQVKGVGPWTAEMFLIFSLHRPDVFSVGDLGLRTAVAKLYRIRRDNLKKIERISKRWKPYRSFACRYLWASLENN